MKHVSLTVLSTVRPKKSFLTLNRQLTWPASHVIGAPKYWVDDAAILKANSKTGFALVKMVNVHDWGTGRLLDANKRDVKSRTFETICAIFLQKALRWR